MKSQTPQDALTEPNFRMDGRVALITGSGRGIGLGIARGLASAGCAVVIHDIDEGVAEVEAARIVGAGGRAVALGGDITDVSLPQRLVRQTVERLGGLHVLVNNASIQTDVDWTVETLEQFRREIDADLITPILLCQQAAPIFRAQRWGRIINLGSIQQASGNPHMLPYAMSKSALQNMTWALSRSLSPEGITVNLIAPGYFLTWRNRDDYRTPAEASKHGKSIPMGRAGKPEDCAGLALLLCSDAGAYITGQTIFVDGGIGRH